MIQFVEKDLKFPIAGKTDVKKWLKAVIEGEGKRTGDIAYIFCTDGYLAELNAKYLNHHTLTDIITFDYCENKTVSGDIFISIDRVRENAGKFSKSFEEELGRVMVHGVLHLLGYGDKTKEDKAIMTEQESKHLVAFPGIK